MELTDSTSGSGGREEQERKDKRSTPSQVSGLIIAGCTLLGVGVGKLVGNGGPFTMFGIGIGLLIAALVYFRHFKGYES